MQQSLRINMCEILMRIQILYQNKQISSLQKNEITKMLKNGLESNNVSDLSIYLRKLKREVNSDFTDIVFECIELID